VGVLGVLDEAGIPIDFIVGTSMGGIVGILYALGIKPDVMAERLIEQMPSNLLNFNLFSARARQRAVQEQLADVIGDKTFADLNIPTAVTAVDMVEGKEVVLNSGALMPALLATSAVPAVFPPVEMDGMQLADGGVIDSLATHIAYKMGADKIIAVDIYPALEKDNPWSDPVSDIVGLEVPFISAALPGQWSNTPSMMAAMWRSVRVITWHLHQERLAQYPADVLLRPHVGHYGSLDFKDTLGPLYAGEEAAQNHLEAIKQLLIEHPQNRGSVADGRSSSPTD
jgi:NTE family protein